MKAFSAWIATRHDGNPHRYSTASIGWRFGLYDEYGPVRRVGDAAPQLVLVIEDTGANRRLLGMEPKP